jgi:hypothetical protein
VLLEKSPYFARMFWVPVAADHYPWVENKAYVEVARQKFEGCL